MANSILKHDAHSHFMYTVYLHIHVHLRITK